MVEGGAEKDEAVAAATLAARLLAVLGPGFRVDLVGTDENVEDVVSTDGLAAEAEAEVEVVVVDLNFLVGGANLRAADQPG